MSVPRGDRLPPVVGGQSVMLTSDTHTERPLKTNQHRAYKMLDDLNRMIGRAGILAWVHGGDSMGNATAAEYVDANGWLAALDRGGAPVVMTPGNHDLVGATGDPAAPYLYTPAQWAAAVAGTGRVTANGYADVGTDLRVIAPVPAYPFPAGVATWRLMLDATTLTWLDARLAETTRRCIIVFHAPLYRSVNYPDDTLNPSSDVAGWYADDTADARIADVLTAHPNVIAWVSGHTHTPPHVNNIVRQMTFGATVLAAVSIGGPFLISDQPAPVSTSALLTVYADRVEVRYRDHGAAQWLSPVHTVML